MKPQPIPRESADKIAALWDEQQSEDIQRLTAAREEAKKRANSATDDLSRDFPWVNPVWVGFDGLSGDEFCAGVEIDYGDALNAWFREENTDRISKIVTAWDRLKGQETTTVPTSGWALDIRTQTAWEIVKASPTGKKVRGKNYRGEFADLKPLVIHGSSVGSGRTSPSRGGWVSCSEELARAIWSLRADRDKMHAENPAIV